MVPSKDEESGSSSSSSRTPYHPRSTHSSETDPLLAGYTDIPTLDFGARRDRHRILYHSSDEPSYLDHIMEKVKSTRLAHLVDKLAVESEPGLTNAQLMLNNHDLKPGRFKF